MMGLEGTWSHTFMTPLPGFDGETIGVFSLASNRVYDAPAVRYAYQSPLTPPAVCDFFPPPSAIQGQLLPESEWEGPTVDVAAAPRGVVVRKQNEVPGYNRDQYRTARVFATAKDGTHVPMSIIYSPSAVETTADATELPATLLHDPAVPLPAEEASRRMDAHGPDVAAAAGTMPCPLKAPAPTLLYGYGSYGICMEPWFNPDVLSLADRGVVFAMAHIRGGEEMGRYWYEDQGKLMAKRNTFTDFIACAEALIGSGWTRRGVLAI
jgi:hypothetical protein